ncbi:hypothetical protein R0137_03650 [Congregibacter brevis]|uniref:Uncharacterized protein n=1 Tax=Congregibacter brevis TaxID=3081201 RepID=A0ABZ0IDP2_9GAMM|nr:hypothetical protein R0137_03650 [Congregibacter sp. IMCC45268]
MHDGKNTEDWTLPNYSAFTDAEIDAVTTWIADGGERIDSVATFTGQAFRVADDSAERNFAPLLVFGPSTELLYPDEPAVFTNSTERVDIEDWYQGVAMSFSEERRPMGMNSPVAKQNAQFALNTMLWLSKLLD